MTGCQHNAAIMEPDVTEVRLPRRNQMKRIAHSAMTRARHCTAVASLFMSRCYNFSLPAETRHSVCALDCPDACGLLINVENGRGGRLRGNPAHPVTRGFLCGKVARYLEREYSPNRLLHPLRRTGKKGARQFETISWDAALDEIAGQLQRVSDEYGPEAILPYSYAGTMGMLNGSGMD